jgi:hypothetical protein
MVDQGAPPGALVLVLVRLVPPPRKRRSFVAGQQHVGDDPHRDPRQEAVFQIDGTVAAVSHAAVVCVQPGIVLDVAARAALPAGRMPV